MKLKACFHTKDATGRYKIMYNEKPVHLRRWIWKYFITIVDVVLFSLLSSLCVVRCQHVVHVRHLCSMNSNLFQILFCRSFRTIK